MQSIDTPPRPEASVTPPTPGVEPAAWVDSQAELPLGKIPTNGTTLRYDIAAWILTGLGLFYVLKMQLLSALLAGLLVHELVQLLAPRIPAGWVGGNRAKVVVVALISVVSVGLVILLILGGIQFTRNNIESLPILLNKMVDTIEVYRVRMPPWLTEYLPSDARSLKAELVGLVREHAGQLQLVGKEAGRTAVHILLGMVIGAMLSLREVIAVHRLRPLARSLAQRAQRLSYAFRRVVFAQVRIAALNAFLTWLYLGVALPLLGVNLPLLKTLVAITFLAGLLPVIGNLISNTVIVIVSLNHSVSVAVGSLTYLVVIHKLEYFLNARIIGSQIRSRAWELLLVMMAMEVSFGMAGVVAAPIFYAYVKDELSARGLI